MKMCAVLFAIATLLLSGASVAEGKTGFFATGKCDDDRIVSFTVQHFEKASARPSIAHIIGSSSDNAKNQEQSIYAGVLLAQLQGEAKKDGWKNSFWKVFNGGMETIGFPEMIITTMVMAPTHGNERLPDNDDALKLARQHVLMEHDERIDLKALKKSNKALATGDMNQLVFPFGNLVPGPYTDVSEDRDWAPKVPVVAGCEISYYFDYWYPKDYERNPDGASLDPWHTNPVSLEGGL